MRSNACMAEDGGNPRMLGRIREMTALFLLLAAQQLEASQASFARLSQLSLFQFLR